MGTYMVPMIKHKPNEGKNHVHRNIASATNCFAVCINTFSNVREITP